MIKPAVLRSGDKVAVVAPASPFDREVFDRGVAELRTIGLDPVFDPSVFERRWYLAGDASVRAAALRSAWQDPSIRAIFAARGGYGSMQLLPWLDPEEMREAPKAFVGYSDVTSIHVFLASMCGLVSVHGPMMTSLARGAEGYDRGSLVATLMRAEPLGELTAEAVEALHPGEAMGVLLGGTLTQLLTSMGTPYAFDPPSGYVLLLDEVAEKPYRLDRLLTQLRQTGLLAKAAAVLCAQFPDCDDPSGEPSGRAVVAHHLRDFPGPVIFGFPTGHVAGAMRTVPLGVAARVVANGRPRLIVEEAAVS